MKLIREWTSLCPDGICNHDFLNEREKYDIKNNDAVYLTGKFSAADEENGNARVYPFNILKREIDLYQKLINENRALGECDHPDSEIINLKNASHVITKLWWDGKTLYGKAKVLSTPSGKIIKSLVADGVQLGVSSRALGSLNESSSGPSIVQEDLMLIAFDIVSEPSSLGAFLSPQRINENVAKRIYNQYSKSYRINRKLVEIANSL